jgi:hypothetical protein
MEYEFLKIKRRNREPKKQKEEERAMKKSLFTVLLAVAFFTWAGNAGAITYYQDIVADPIRFIPPSFTLHFDLKVPQGGSPAYIPGTGFGEGRDRKSVV